MASKERDSDGLERDWCCILAYLESWSVTVNQTLGGFLLEEIIRVAFEINDIEFGLL